MEEEQELTLTLKKTLAWAVHAYTALGLVAAAGIAVALVEGGPGAFRWAFWLMLVAMLIDGTDGTLARAVRIKETLPQFDGRRLDDLIDFHTYATLPLLLIWRAALIPPEWAAWLLVPLLAAAYGFCQTNIKTDDGYFVGFPSYWNVVTFYLYVLEPPAEVALGLILFFAVLTFVPTRYLYPTQPGWLNRATLALGVPWGIAMVVILWRLPGELQAGRHADETTRMMAIASLAFPVYYLVASWAISTQIATKKRPASSPEGAKYDSPGQSERSERRPG